MGRLEACIHQNTETVSSVTQSLQRRGKANAASAEQWQFTRQEIDHVAHATAGANFAVLGDWKVQLSLVGQAAGQSGRCRPEVQPLRVALALRWVVAAAAAQAGDMLNASVGQALAEEGSVGATWVLVRPKGTSVGSVGRKVAPRKLRMSPDDGAQ
jgi:hypothetical protein